MDEMTSEGTVEAISDGQTEVLNFLEVSSLDPEEVSAKLRAEFPDDALRSRDGGRNQKLVYVDRYQAVHRVIEATSNVFDMFTGDPFFLPLKDRDGNERTVCAIKVTVSIPGLGTREGLGVQDLRDGSGEDLIKGAIADGFKVALSYFGMALELYNADNPTLSRIKQRDGGNQRNSFGNARPRGF